MNKIIEEHLKTLKNNIGHFIATDVQETVWSRIRSEMESLYDEVNKNYATAKVFKK